MWFVIAFAAVFIALVVIDLMQRPKQAREAAENRARRDAEVTRRGWTLESTTTRDQRTIVVISGTTGGVNWTCEMNARTFSNRVGEMSHERVFTRWSASEPVLREGLLSIWPRFGKAPEIGPAMPEFVLELLLTPLVRALGTDAATAEMLHTATVVSSGDTTVDTHYLIRATDGRLMHHVLDAGARAVLAEVASWFPVRSNPHHLVLATFGSQGVTILLKGWVEDLEVVDRVAVVGAALTNAFRAANRG